MHEPFALAMINAATNAPVQGRRPPWTMLTVHARHPQASIDPRVPMPPAEPAAVALAGSDRAAYEKAAALPAGRVAASAEVCIYRAALAQITE